MGDRINLRFRYKDEVSPVLYSHWDGRSLLDRAEQFFNEYRGEIRREPSNWMVNFISFLREGCIGDGNLYLYADFDGCCADDNGDWEFDLENGTYKRV